MASPTPLPPRGESPMARKIRLARQSAVAAHERAEGARRVATAAREDAMRIRDSIRDRRLSRGNRLEPLDQVDE